MAIGKTVEEMFAEKYPEFTLTEDGITYDTLSMSLKSAFGLMFIHNMSVDDVVAEVKNLSKLRKEIVT